MLMVSRTDYLRGSVYVAPEDHGFQSAGCPEVVTQVAHKAFTVPPRGRVDRLPNVLRPLLRENAWPLWSGSRVTSKRGGGSHDRPGVPCKGCDLIFPTAFNRDIHLRKTDACIDCHLHSADTSTEHEEECGGRIASKLGLYPSSKSPSKVIAGLPESEKMPLHLPQLDQSLQDTSIVYLAPVSSIDRSKTCSQPTSTTLTPMITFTPEPDPPPTLLALTSRTTECFQCLACPAVHASLSASLEHLNSPECPARLSAARIAKLQSAWYPWECAIIIEIDARTTDFEMTYFCPTCGAPFDTVASAISHMEDAADGKEDKQRRTGQAMYNIVLAGHEPQSDEPHNSDRKAELLDCCTHADVLHALTAGLRRLKRSFEWARKADGIVDVLAKTYTPYACFSGVIDGRQLQELQKLRRNARQAYIRAFESGQKASDAGAVA